MKTYKKKQGLGTRKKKPIANSSIISFQKEVTVVFLEILLMVKLYHWKTYSYATHKATDDLYTKLNANIDSFIEVLLGKTGVRSDLTSHKNIRLLDLTSLDSFKREIESFKGYLVSLNNNLGTLTIPELIDIS